MLVWFLFSQHYKMVHLYPSPIIFFPIDHPSPISQPPKSYCDPWRQSHCQRYIFHSWQQFCLMKSIALQMRRHKINCNYIIFPFLCPLEWLTSTNKLFQYFNHTTNECIFTATFWLIQLEKRSNNVPPLLPSFLIKTGKCARWISLVVHP